jgi:transcriptional regulator with PAS, ATPase and Fis domain
MELSKKAIKKAIVEEALKIKRKREIYEEVKKYNNELKTLNEHIGMIGSFGFQSPNDVSNKTKTGFVNDFQNISHIAELEREMASTEDAEKLNEENEINRLKAENEALRKQLESFTNNPSK